MTSMETKNRFRELARQKKIAKLLANLPGHSEATKDLLLSWNQIDRNRYARACGIGSIRNPRKVEVSKSTWWRFAWAASRQQGGTV